MTGFRISRRLVQLHDARRVGQKFASRLPYMGNNVNFGFTYILFTVAAVFRLKNFLGLGLVAVSQHQWRKSLSDGSLVMWYNIGYSPIKFYLGILALNGCKNTVIFYCFGLFKEPK
jgi:hypothetical protein